MVDKSKYYLSALCKVITKKEEKPEKKAEDKPKKSRKKKGEE